MPNPRRPGRLPEKETFKLKSDECTGISQLEKSEERSGGGGGTGCVRPCGQECCDEFQKPKQGQQSWSEKCAGEGMTEAGDLCMDLRGV